jgi:hypothetical protein
MSKTGYSTDNNRKKRGNEVLFDNEMNEQPSSSNSSNKRLKPNPIQLDAVNISPNTNNILDELKQLGEQINKVAISSTTPESVINEQYENIKTKFLNAFNEIMNNTKQVMEANQLNIQQQENQAFLEQQNYQLQQLRATFLSSIGSLTDRITNDLTYGDQSKLYQDILFTLNNRLNEKTNELINEPNHLFQLRELGFIIYTWSMEQITITITNLYQSSPQITRQFIAILSASTMIYNYLPDTMRSLFIAIPYFGPIFRLMNTINPQVVILQNTVATITSIYYLLRNAGIETAETVESLKTSVMQISKQCAINAGIYTCDNANVAYNALSLGAQNILNIIGSRLGDMIGNPYENANFFENSQNSYGSRQSSKSSNTIGSQLIVDINNKPNSVVSEKSQISVGSVKQLLTTPVSEGGINVSQNIDNNIVSNRMEEIVNLVQGQSLTNNPILATPIQIANQTTVVPVYNQELLSDSSSENNSNVSELSEEENTWIAWFYGTPNVGGYRRKNRGNRRKSKRRNTKNKKSYNKRKNTKKRSRYYRKH